VKNCLTV